MYAELGGGIIYSRGDCAEIVRSLQEGRGLTLRDKRLIGRNWMQMDALTDVRRRNRSMRSTNWSVFNVLHTDH